jgi:CP family cyanate transporter-like MFS transporter
MLWPARGAWVEALAIGLSQGLFPLNLTLISLRARTSDGTAALSGFTQGVGYLIAAVGPLLMGIVYGVTGGWTLPLLMLSAIVVLQAVSGLLVARPRYVEDGIPGQVSEPSDGFASVHSDR